MEWPVAVQMGRPAVDRRGGLWSTAIGAVVWFVFLCVPSAGAVENEPPSRLERIANWVFPPAPKEDIDKFRRSWNPVSAGPMFTAGIDVPAKGKLVFHPYLFGQIAHQQVGNQLGGSKSDAPVHLNGWIWLALTSYGLTDSVEATLAVTWVDWWTTQQNANASQRHNAQSLGDTTLLFRHRVIVQDSDSWRPTVTLFHSLYTPTGRWTGISGFPGGIPPLKRIPQTRGGDLTVTEGIMLRKNLRPFRIMATAYYSYGAPWNPQGHTLYGGDLINWRVMIEHLLNEERGFGYIIEVVGLNGLPFRLDGHKTNVPAPGQTSAQTFSTIAIGPTLEYRLGKDYLIAGGVLFTAVAQNYFDAIYPNFTMSYIW